VVEEAEARIRETVPDAVTFSEACRRDVAAIARRTGYHLRFADVIYGGAELPCVDPGGRGLFGNAVLTKAPITATADDAFHAEAGDLEQRRWLCVTTSPGVDVCTTHLMTRHSFTTAATNDAQCAELRAVLTRRAAGRAVLFAGDVNRRASCSPDGFWSRTDGSADQAAGLQHAYGSAGLGTPSSRVVPAEHSDHDVLLVRVRAAGG
jgi:endonuclease/exonuclease/phosphatase family metal-dependent hydrolase